jgi:REP element-mobilizing transposase RayT
MARQLRITYEGAVYHITARGNEQRPIVRDDRDRRRTLAQMVEHYRVVCHAWVLMDNHYHLLLETPTPNLSRAVRHLNGVYTQRFNRRHQRVGHLFQGRFKAILVERESYLLELCRYVVLNPVRANLARHPRGWTWSSYRATAGEEAAPAWLQIGWILAQFGRGGAAARAAYRRFVAEGIARADPPWTQVRGQIYLGSDAFVAEVAARHARPDSPDIPRAQQRPTHLSVEACLQRIARAYRVEIPTLLETTRRPSEAREVALYAARRIAGATLGDVARRFGLSYSGASRRVAAVDAQLKRDPRWQRRVAEVLDVKFKT